MDRINFRMNELESHLHFNFSLEARAAFAWDLIKTHPNIAGVEDGNDPTGRAKLRLQSPKELVTRSFEIADLFFAEVTNRGEIHEPALTAEDRAKKAGQLDAIRREETYKPMTDRSAAREASKASKEA